MIKKSPFDFVGKVWSYVTTHKVASVIALLVFLLIGYWGYGRLTSTAGETRYVMATAQKGTLVMSVTSAGQVSTSNALDLKPQVSGTVSYVAVNDGASVRQGALILTLDARDAQKTVRDTELSLEQAQLDRSKMAGNPASGVRSAADIAADNVIKAREDGLNTVANTFLNLPTIVSGMNSILYSTTLNSSQTNLDYYANAIKTSDPQGVLAHDDAVAKYQKARTAYDQNFSDYKSISRFSDPAAIDQMINETYNTAKLAADSAQSASNMVQLYQDDLTKQNLKPVALSNTDIANLNTYTGQLNAALSNLFSALDTIKTSNESVAGADLNLQAQDLLIRQRQNALADAKEQLAYYSVRAPFDGVVAKLNVKKDDAIGPGTIITSFITQQKIAEISLNEVDAATIKQGQKATLTFDAIDGLSIAGKVVQIDTVGTMSQGVVTYNVKIAFDTQDDRVKSGMSINAAIITDVRQDVLLVPNNAVKSQGNAHYVEMFDTPAPAVQGNQGFVSPMPPRQQTVTIGISNDTSTEITSGLNEGDQVVSRTITAAAAAPQAPSLFGAPGRSGGGGSIPRATGR